MALHEVQISENIIELQYEVFVLQKTLEFVLANIEISNLENFDEARLRRQAYKYLKGKFPDEDLQQGDWIS